MTRPTYTVLTVTVVDRDDGGSSVSSDDLPGLILSGANKNGIVAAIAPAIKAIFEHRGFRNVSVHHLTPIGDILRSESAHGFDVKVQHGKAGVQQQLFVVEVDSIAA